jgi:hypothetical protein
MYRLNPATCELLPQVAGLGQAKGEEHIKLYKAQKFHLRKN